MSSSFELMTEKMQMLFMDIVASLGKLPPEQKGYIFGYEGEEDLEWVMGVANNIVLEFIKYSYDYNDPEYSMRHFLKDADDSERMLQSRTMQYVLKYKRKELLLKGGPNLKDHKYDNIDMDTMDKKIEGHHMTEMNYFENQNVHDLELIKAIVERRIVNSKQISNTSFQEMFERYDELIESLIERSKNSDEDMVFASLAFFTLEWHYSVEMNYFLSYIMENEKIDAVDQSSFALLCGYLELESRFGGWYTTDSRIIKERLLIMPYLFGKNTDKNDCEEMKDLIKEILVLIVIFTENMFSEEGEQYKDCFRKESTMADWASFFRYYDIFAIWQKKEWTRKRIQNMRYLYNLSLCPKD